MLGFDEAVARVAEAASFLGAEDLPLADAAGRILAEDVAADLDLPPFDTTAMDGWAVRTSDVSRAPARLAIAGAIGAGNEPPGPLKPGTALKVMTGAPLPPGSDAVVPVEEAAELPDGAVELRQVPRPGQHIRRRGEVISAGEALLSPGRRLTAAGLALAAVAGRPVLRVARRARAGVLVTGDEIVPAGERPGPGRIRNSNGPLLCGALRRLGADAIDLGVAPDDRPRLRRALDEALAAGLDLLLTTGGVSAGDYDFVGGVLKDLGADVRFHRIALRPAKPVLFAVHGRTLVFGLPGNPVSTAIAFDFLVRTAWRAASGLTPPLPPPVGVLLGAPASNKGARLALHPATVSFERGRAVARPLATKGSHDIAAHARAGALLRLEPESSFAEGALVPAYLASEETTFG